MGAVYVRILRAASMGDVLQAAILAALLWPDTSAVEHYETLMPLVAGGNGAVMMAMDEADMPIGFAQCALRRDYVEGTCTSPVGYLEGVYVMSTQRRQGVARALVDACRAWAKEQGCTEFASDCELDNDASRAFHLAIGFAEANRIICFTQKL